MHRRCTGCRRRVSVTSLERTPTLRIPRRRCRGCRRRTPSSRKPGMRPFRRTSPRTSARRRCTPPRDRTPTRSGTRRRFDWIHRSCRRTHFHRSDNRCAPRPEHRSPRRRFRRSQRRCTLRIDLRTPSHSTRRPHSSPSRTRLRSCTPRHWARRCACTCPPTRRRYTLDRERRTRCRSRRRRRKTRTRTDFGRCTRSRRRASHCTRLRCRSSPPRSLHRMRTCLRTRLRRMRTVRSSSCWPPDSGPFRRSSQPWWRHRPCSSPCGTTTPPMDTRTSHASIRRRFLRTRRHRSCTPRAHPPARLSPRRRCRDFLERCTPRIGHRTPNRSRRRRRSSPTSTGFRRCTRFRWRAARCTNR